MSKISKTLSKIRVLLINTIFSEIRSAELTDGSGRGGGGGGRGRKMEIGIGGAG